MRAMTGNASEGDVGRRGQPRLVEPTVPRETFDPETLARHAAIAREVYAARRRRHKALPADLFGEPTWDILLDLYIAMREDRRVPTTSACIGAHVPPTTALRWLRILETRGLIEREDDGRDGRRTFVRLTRHGIDAMDRTLAMLDKSINSFNERKPTASSGAPTPPE
ncbi:MAG: hypothetical protein B7Y36_08880 [Novosphingobium sp. 28-62-57]|nr:MAG: hypothetical protein B7Z36_01965 [Novosphingobium sp. 12-63-9]OYZ10917.1 MAG: hypothetical protein B7Y36_08880 [Novosphingobium sp. 28-62-57]OZA35755.1 MAG: hypothetical protein B7X92_09185 [Novosphingobium sp. 17-62-9]